MENLFSSTLDSLRDYVFKHLCFIVQVGHNVEALEREAGILGGILKDVSEKIQTDERAAKKPTNEVEMWIKLAGDLQQKARSIKTEYDNRSCMFPGTCSSCSFNCFSNYYIGSAAAEELLKIQREVKYYKEDIKEITTEVLPPSAQEMSTTALTAEAGHEIGSKLKVALDFLRDDARGALGLWGMGGVGKTTLLEHINNSLAKDPSFGFHHVIFLVASRDCTVEKIRGLLVQKLGIGNGEQIFSHLSNKSFVLLLDDLWEALDLKQVGIPLPLGTHGGQHKRKLILTTRFQQVCHNMDVQRSIRVECLSPEAARLLFREKVGENAINSHPLIGELADRVADECDGLPLALITIGRAMSQNQTVQVWENALGLLRASKLSKIPGMVDDPLPLLKFSYDHLKDPMDRECFLHCALWPEDEEILKVDLIECWIGHGLLQEYEDIQEAYNRGYAIIDTLQKACLLERVNAYSYTLRGDRVKLHDVIRDMALWIARDCGENEKRWIALGGHHMKEAPQDERTWSEAHKMSLMNNSITALPSKAPSSPKLTTLMLRGSYNLLGNGMGIIKYFYALKYLDLSYCRSMQVFPIEICSLEKLEYLNLSYIGRNSEMIILLPKELKNLLNLKYLFARDVNIGSESTELLQSLVSLLYLDFSSMDMGTECFPKDWVIDNLDCLEGRLKGLGINVSTVSHLQKLAQLSGIPVRTLCIHEMEGLTSLHLLSKDVLGRQHMRSNLNALKIEYCTQIEELVVEGKHRLPLDSLSLRCLFRLNEILWKGVEPRDMLPMLRYLDIYRCKKLKNVTWIVNLLCLERLHLSDCKNMEHVICEAALEETEDRCRLAFPKLRSLYLKCLPKLSSICHRGTLTFPSLEHLHVFSCPGLEKFPFHSQSSCSNLRTIEGEREWWERLELEDGMKTSLQPLFQDWS